jgi:hypothetical protein
VTASDMRGPGLVSIPLTPLHSRSNNNQTSTYDGVNGRADRSLSLFSAYVGMMVVSWFTAALGPLACCCLPT